MFRSPLSFFLGEDNAGRIMLGPQPGKMGKAERMYLELEMSERPSRLGRIASGFIGGGHSGIPDQNLLE